ncbi:MAG: prephenate dehydratase [Saprospiraceae bacterium]
MSKAVNTIYADYLKPAMSISVAIQGYRGAFHDIAVQKYFGAKKLEIIETDTFDQIIDKVTNKQVEFGAMAIENTIYGMLMPNFNLLHRSRVFIDGEISLRIKQNLICWPGTSLEEIKEVHSHPIAIEQCREFFKAYPQIKLIESVDTAYSVKEIKEKRLKTRGAIASTLAADIYGMQVLVHSIETNKKNFTRFLIVEKKSKSAILPKANKASIIFTLADKVGSLHQVLSQLSNHEANLTKIQSIPVLGKPFEYAFWVDLISNDAQQLIEAIEKIKPFIHELKILGVYPKGVHYDH